MSLVSTFIVARIPALQMHDIEKCYHTEGYVEQPFAMNSAQQRTLEAIFARPTRADVRWLAIESLIRALGGEVTERAGSRVAARLNGVTAVFHRPHPRPETKKGAVEAVRQFLVHAGVKP
jgi:hypothetical protein